VNGERAIVLRMDENKTPVGLEAIESELRDVDARIRGFEQSLPKQLDPLALSRAKVPFKALSSREALFWRFTELARDAHDAFARKRLATAITLARACVETTAAMWHLWRRVERCNEEGALGDFDDFVMKLSLGSRTNPDAPRADSVLKFIDSVTKEISDFRDQYEKLSEYAHPNWGGTVGLYCKHDHDEVMVYYGSNVRENQYPFAAGIYNLSVAVRLFGHSYNSMAETMPQFVTLCEAVLAPEEDC
jgi:hypothetical protein